MWARGLFGSVLVRHRASTGCRDAAIRALVQQHEGPVHKLRVWKPHWGCLSGQLHSLKLTQAKAIVARILRERCDFTTAAAGMVKVLPFSPNDRRWLLEVHCVVVG